MCICVHVDYVRKNKRPVEGGGGGGGVVDGTTHEMLLYKNEFIAEWQNSVSVMCLARNEFRRLAERGNCAYLYREG